MIHSLIVPGVGGSDHNHWQSWLQRQLMSCSRVQQQDWNLPILSRWVENFVETLDAAPEAVQVIAHSFGCLTSVAALAQHPELAKKVKKLILVAPANPARFAPHGFAENSEQHYASYFQQLQIQVPAQMLISENDPWLSYEDAQALAQHWNVPVRNLGRVGHINVDSGFQRFPEIFNDLLTDRPQQLHDVAADRLFFKLAM